MHVAIIGGGIGGLSTALYLHQQGIDCRVYESVPEYKPLGVGINLFPHAMRRLFELGLEDAVREVGVEAKEFTFFNQHGQLIYREPCGRHAGYDWPHFSFHRADLHRVLLDAVMARLGPDAVHNGHRCSGFSQDDQGVTLQLDTATTSHAVRADVAIACDGFHSAVRRQLYPEEAPAHFGGINLWRGVTRGQPFLSGASVTRCGALRHGKLVVYPIRNHADGTQTINWAVEILKSDWSENDWNKTGQLSDFIDYFSNRCFPWLDIPRLFREAEFILEYPMVDRDPIPRWSFGRVTLLGDAAHPMYPRGGNGGAQSILDAELLASLLANCDDPVQALQAYEAERRPKTRDIVLTNRSTPPDAIIERVDALTASQPFARIEDVISLTELQGMSELYKQVTSMDRAAVNVVHH
jgi:2-polyprenyl-6-methoxyphenol hydroxylase-like FAD-dependent oxidoreductase